MTICENCQKQFKKLGEIEKHILGSEKELINNKEQKQIIYEKWKIYCDAVNRLIESMNLPSSPKKSWIKKHVVELLSLSKQFEREWHSQQPKINYVIFEDDDEEDNDNNNNDDNDNKTIDNHHYEKENYNSNDVVNNYHNNNHHHHHHYYCRHNRYCNRKHPRMIILKKINDKMKTERHLLREATKITIHIS